jgi:hypothetical protein
MEYEPAAQVKGAGPRPMLRFAANAVWHQMRAWRSNVERQSVWQQEVRLRGRCKYLIRWLATRGGAG